MWAKTVHFTILLLLQKRWLIFSVVGDGREWGLLGGVFVSGHTQFRNVAPIFFRSSIEPVNGIDPNSLSKPPYYRLKRRQKTRNQSYANCRWAASRSKRIKTVILLTFQHSGITGCEIGMQGFYKHLSFFFFYRSSKLSEHLIQIALTWL